MKKTAVAILLLSAPCAFAKVDLVTLPNRDKVQITVYNSADLTIMRDTRILTMKEGGNRLQYSWAGTLMDPTSLELAPKEKADKILIRNLEFPPRTTGLGVWNVESGVSGPVPFEISAFTSGISWNAYYVATLGRNSDTMDLEGYVRVNNNSGEDYENAQTRLLVGKVNLVENIADLAQRTYPFGSPIKAVPYAPSAEAKFMRKSARALEDRAVMSEAMAVAEARPKEIVKEGLSEYFLYTIEGTEDLTNGWGKRLISFTAKDIPVSNLFRYDERRYGSQPVWFVSFKNDAAHKLGKEPIPDGQVKVFAQTADKGGQAFVGSQSIKYIPRDEEVLLNLGTSDKVSVVTTMMEYATENYEWREETPQLPNDITGYDEIVKYKVEVGNYQDFPVKVELRKYFSGKPDEWVSQGDYGAFERIDAGTLQYLLELAPKSKKIFTYTQRNHIGSRAR